MAIRYPDYQHSIANLACSVLKHFGIAPPNATLDAADALLAKNYRNVVVLLLDGMGTNILEKYLNEDGFFRSHHRLDYSSTFPPTTVAATTAVSSGLFPNQSAWLGWTGYFPEMGRNVVYFLNKDNDTEEQIESFHVARTYVPYDSLADRIRKMGAEAYEVAPFLPPYPGTYDDFCSEISHLCASGGKKFIYAYWDQPDKEMHPQGIEAPEIKEILTEIEEKTRGMTAEMEDTLLMITADHGMIGVECAALTEYPEILDCLVRPPSMEARAVNLFVKPDKKGQFEKAFRARFDGSFLLLTKDEVLRQQLLGTGENHLKLNDMLGDYLAIATGSTAIRMQDKGYSAEHAGLTEEEMTIPLIVVEKE